jgi:tetratricopeptide (TPR) repeat protein
MRANLIAESAAGHRFTHDLIRRSLDDSLSAERRKLLHRRLAGAMIAAGSASGADIARHLEEGGRPSDAVPYRIRAAEVAARTYAHPEALLQFERALADGAAGHEAFRIHSARCELFRNLGDDAGRGEALEAMAGLAARLGDPAVQVEMAIKQTVDHFEHDRYEAALQTVEAALRTLHGRIDQASEAMLLLELGATLKSLGRIGEAEAKLRVALETFRDISPVKYANTAYWLCQCLIERGDIAGAQRYCDVSLEATARAGYRRGHALSLSTSADLAFRNGDHATGLERLEQARREAQEIGSPPLERVFLEALAERLRQAGRADEAAARSAELAAIRRA